MIYLVILTCVVLFHDVTTGFLFIDRRQPQQRFSTLSLSAATSKSEEEAKFIKTSLLQNALFAELPETALQTLVDAFEEKEAKRGEKIVCQGDSCDGGYVYLVAKGRCHVLVDNKIVPEPYGIIGPKVVFGELGILYDERRAATVAAKDESVSYYRVDGVTFKAALNKPMESLTLMQEIDAAINQISGTNALYDGDIIPPYKPDRIWLWRQYSGTVLSTVLETTLLSMVLCAMFVTFARQTTGEVAWSIDFLAPDESLPFVQRLSQVHEIWDIQKGLTTFVLTFFVNQSFNFWRAVYQLARDVQGKLNGFNLVLATSVKHNEDGTLTDEAEIFLEDVGQYSRLFHILMWASKAKRFSVLITSEGLQRMASRGLMSDKQLKLLQSLDLPSDQLFIAPLEWMMIRSNKAADEGILYSDNATKGTLLREYSSLRDSYVAISNKLDGRMPLPYVQFVQVLVDGFVLITPLALYGDLGEFSVIAVGLVTLFYTGLNNLAKIFLDPLNNENFCENSIFMDLGVLIRESNGDSTKWRRGSKVPF